MCKNVCYPYYTRFLMQDSWDGNQTIERCSGFQVDDEGLDVATQSDNFSGLSRFKMRSFVQDSTTLAFAVEAIRNFYRQSPGGGRD